VSPARTNARKARSDGSGNRLTRPQPICDPNPISKARSGSSQRAGGEQCAPVFPVLENNFLVFADYLWLPVSRAHNNDLGSPMARYFVIHDTSGPNYGHRPFPDDINENPKLNNLRNFYCPDGWGKAHVFISRTGELLVGHDYSVAWRETKFEQAAEFGSALQGLFLHNELIQPRRSVPGHGGRNDARSPDPAFTTAQYDRLALAYVVASVRAERWFVPAFHAAIDAQIPNGHDDPLNFDIDSFARSLDNLMVTLGRPGQVQAARRASERGCGINITAPAAACRLIRNTRISQTVRTNADTGSTRNGHPTTSSKQKPHRSSKMAAAPAP
jgi:hypothetical protein